MAEVIVEREGPVAVVTLNRPQAMNALSQSPRHARAAAIAELDADPQIRA